MGTFAITQPRSSVPRVGLALAVLAAHALVLHLVFDPFTHISGPKTDSPALTWLRLELTARLPVVTPANTIGQPNPSLAPAPAITRTEPRYPALAPPHDPAAAALNPYVACALPDDNRLWIEDQKRCAQRLWDLYKDAPPREQTEAEKELARKFERDLKIQNAPFLVPCFSPTGGIAVTCLLRGLSQGFEPNAGYAETDMRDTQINGMPRPPKLPGMRSGMP